MQARMQWGVTLAKWPNKMWLTCKPPKTIWYPSIGKKVPLWKLQDPSPYTKGPGRSITHLISLVADILTLVLAMASLVVHEPAPVPCDCGLEAVKNIVLDNHLQGLCESPGV